MTTTTFTTTTTTTTTNCEVRWPNDHRVHFKPIKAAVHDDANRRSSRSFSTYLLLYLLRKRQAGSANLRSTHLNAYSLSSARPRSCATTLQCPSGWRPPVPKCRRPPRSPPRPPSPPCRRKSTETAATNVRKEKRQYYFSLKTEWGND